MDLELSDHTQQDTTFRIEITLDEDFKTQFQKLKKKYSEKMFEIEGLSKENLNITHFFDKFMNSNNVANASIDDNSNVTEKNISVMLSESRKPYNKLLSHNKIYIELKESFGKEKADEWLELQINGALYSHDSHESTLKPYSYFGEETILIKYKNKTMLVSFKDLYEVVNEPEVLLHKKDEAYCKYTNDLLVWDKDQWTKIIKVIKKPKTTDFMFIKGSNGVSQIVTTNHPVITTKGDVDAINVTKEHSIITAKPQFEFGTKTELNITEELLKAGFEREEIMLRGENITEETDVNQNVQVSLKHGTNPIPNIFQLDRDFGWLYGMILAEGCVTEHNISICQSYSNILDEVIRILEEKRLPYYMTQKDNSGCKVINIRATVLRHVLVNTFEYSNGAKNKKLPSNFLDYNKEFIKGIVGGLLDGDGTLMLESNRRITIRLTSRYLLNQISFLVQQMGYNVRDGKPYYKEDNGRSFKQKNYIYQIAFTPYKDGEDFTSIKIKNNVESYSTKERSDSYTNSKYSFGYGDVKVINVDLLDKIDDEFVYDISTETGHFMCNNILSHNCFAFSLKPIVEKGLYFIKDMKAHPAKHLDTFNHHVLEFISYATNMQSGAVGIPDYLIYAYYYWQNDINTGYAGDADTYKKQKWQEILFNLNQPYLKGGEQSAYTNFSILDREHIIGLLGTEYYPDGSLIIDHLEEIIQYQKDFLDYEKELRHEKFFTFPVISASLLFQNEKYVDEDMAKYICKHNMEWQDVNIYNAKEIDSLSSCCRLTSSLKDIQDSNDSEEDLKGHFNSIGGSSISIGSTKVNTINLVRIALETKGNFEEYKKILKGRIDISHKYLYVQREVLKKNIAKGLLPLYTYELMDMKRQFSTIGITGVFEAIKLLGGISESSTGVYYNETGLQMASEILDTITEANKTTKKRYGYNANTEQIPSESCAIKICKKDKLIFGQDCVNTYIYGNQWIPLNQHCDVMERVKTSSVLDSKCGGGVMLHINLAEPFKDEEQAWELMNKLAREGIIYFSFVVRINVCKNDHSFFGDKCPTCGGEVTDSYIKIVGYLVKSSSYKSERAKEMEERVSYNM